MNFDYLIHTIQDTHLYLQAAVAKAINSNLRLHRQFYKTYPELVDPVTNYFKSVLQYSSIDRNLQIHQTVSDELIESAAVEIHQTLSDELTPAIYEALSKLPAVASSAKRFGLTPDKLLKSLSFSHFVELVKIDDDLKRAFYEIECAKGVWSVRELKRQVESLYFERSGLSKRHKGNTMVKYATAGLDKNIFVQKYMLELPNEKELEDYIKKEMN